MSDFDPFSDADCETGTGDTSSAVNNTSYARGALFTQPCDGSASSNDDDDSASSSDDEASGPHIANAFHGHRSAGYDSPSTSYLRAQSNKLFSGIPAFGAAGDNDSSSSDDEDSSDSDSSADEEKKAATPIQERRARNIHRHEAYFKSLNFDELKQMNGAEAKREKKQHKHTTASEGDTIHDTSVQYINGMVSLPRRRGMRFTTKSNTISSSAKQLPKPLPAELNDTYPHRDDQIKTISAYLEAVVHKTTMAWRMTNNVKSFGNVHYSETSYHGDVKLAAPNPIMVSGSGGTGKTSIVRDAVRLIAERTNDDPKYQRSTVVSEAYIDCSTADGVSLVTLLNSAFNQLHDYYSGGDSVDYHSKIQYVKETIKYGSGTTNGNANTVPPSSVVEEGNADYLDLIESDAEDEDDDGVEELIEKQRFKLKRKRRNKSTKHVAVKQARTQENSVRSSKFFRHARRSISKSAPIDHTTQLQKSSQKVNDSAPIASFGRAMSSLLQGGSTRKGINKYGRCAFLVIDNAERMLAWKKGSRNGLANLLMLPNMMGLNLMLILISQSTLLPYTGG